MEELHRTLKTLTFTVCHAESIENLNVIHSNVSPAFSLHQTFDNHLAGKSIGLFFRQLFLEWKKHSYGGKYQYE